MKENVSYEPFQNPDAIPTAHTVSNLSSKGFVMHEKKIDLPHIINQELLETVGEKVTSLSVTPTAVNNDWTAIVAQKAPLHYFRNRSDRKMSSRIQKDHPNIPLAWQSDL